MFGKRLVDQDLLFLQSARKHQFLVIIGLFDEALFLAKFSDEPSKEFDEGDKKVILFERQGVRLRMSVKTVVGCDAYIEVDINFDGVRRGGYQLVYTSSAKKALWKASPVQHWPKSSNVALEEFKKTVGELEAEENGGIGDAKALSIFVDMINTFRAAPALPDGG